MRTRAIFIGCAALLLAAQLGFAAAAPAKPTVCPPRPGYRALVDTDHKGDDLGKYGADAFNKCDADVNCVGFTGAGVAKKNLVPTIYAKGKCLYVKIPTICEPMGPHFNASADVDCVGDVIQTYDNTTDIDFVYTACLTDANCTAFTSAGVTKNCTGPLFAKRGTCLYTFVPTPCPEFPGFKVTPDADHKGDDIAEYGALAAAACLSDPTCRGFTSYGTGKRTVIPSTLDRLNSVCLYQKIAKTDCDPIPGYAAIPNVDRYGDDIVRVNPSVAPGLCDNDTSCVGFNNNGWLKRSIFPLYASFSYCFYIKVATVCPSYPGYTATPDVNRLDDTIMTLEPETIMEEALSICNADPACQALNTKRELKSSTGPLVASRGNCFYTKKPTVCPFIFGYTAKPDVYVDGERIGSYGNAAMAQCSANPHCQAFDSFGALTSVAEPLAYAFGNCVYVKN